MRLFLLMLHIPVHLNARTICNPRILWKYVAAAAADVEKFLYCASVCSRILALRIPLPFQSPQIFAGTGKTRRPPFCTSGKSYSIVGAIQRSHVSRGLEKASASPKASDRETLGPLNCPSFCLHTTTQNRKTNREVNPQSDPIQRPVLHQRSLLLHYWEYFGRHMRMQPLQSTGMFGRQTVVGGYLGLPLGTACLNYRIHHQHGTCWC